MLVQAGFRDRVILGQIGDSNIISGAVKQSRDALLILQDTREVQCQPAIHALL
jgi:hypothetical protein